MHIYKIELTTMSDIKDFVGIVTAVSGSVKLTDTPTNPDSEDRHHLTGFCVNGKSLLGAMATVEWNSLYCVSEQDIYSKISKYCA